MAKAFLKIEDLLQDTQCFVCILVGMSAHFNSIKDEVESLTAARSAALSGSEPSDAIRVYELCWNFIAKKH